MSQGFRVDIASPPDRERLVAEVFFGHEQIAEVNQEAGKLQVEIYARPSSEPWVLDYQDFLQALTLATQRLTSMDSRSDG
jgi:hypothetical protein